MLDAAWFWWSGYLQIRVSGSRVERFLNLLVEHGVYVWGIRREDDHVLLYLGVLAFRAIRPIARATGSRVRITQKLGLPFFLRQFRQRRMLALGAILFIAILYTLSSFIWFIEIQGLETVSAERILTEAAHYGIRPGALKTRARIADFAFELPMKLDKVVWVSVELLGTKATVKVIEQTLPPSDTLQRGPADVVAAKDGVVREVLVLAGTPVVEQGDTVISGQCLISGKLQPSEQAVPPPGDEPQPTTIMVRARGRVKATVWYETYVEVPLERTVNERTGATYTRRMIRLGAEEIIVSGRSPVPFNYYEVETDGKNLVPWRKGFPPVEVITLTYHEVSREVERVADDIAVQLAIDEALEQLTPIIPVDAKIEDTAHTVVLRQGGVVGVRVVVQTLEDIGITVPLQEPGQAP